ncbi:NUMOD4 domain-containing protein [Flavobacterium algicola]|uniref:NUMOD4 domain-containing protein n=1 Tax=Flavobacterium algicola TaxID=556529 RepID=UPI001EFCAB8B|nr:NUMOD4 domain-containing protein [Flavobacterium algicola]MCG9792478.1 hypothetical protein [Flavobacterium algicola]
MEDSREPEVWKPIPGYEGKYEVSSFGNVRRLMILKTSKSQSGYPMITLQVDNKKVYKALHVLVAQSFCEKKEYHRVVNHKDSDINNMYYKNLEWVSIRENVAHSKKGDNYSSKYTGVYFNHGKFIASISIDGKRKHLGVYDTEEEAHYVYMKVIEALGEDQKYYKKGFKFRKDIDLSVLDEIYKPRVKTSKYRGVYFSKNSQKFVASISVNRKKKIIGSAFLTEEDAYQALVNYIKNNKVK